MVSVLDRKLRRDLLQARATLMAILLVIVVGIACFVGLVSVYVNLERSRLDYYARCRMADFWVDLKKLPLSEVADITRMPGVAETRSRIVFSAVVDLPGVPKPLTGQVISLPDTPRPVINDIVLRRGTYFTGDRLSEVIVNDAFARARGLHPGDTVNLVLNNRKQAMVVVGTAISSEFVYLISPGTIVPDPAANGVFYVKRSFAEEVLDFSGACNQVVGRLTPDVRDHPRALLDAIERRLAPYGVFAAAPRAEWSSHRFLSDEIAGLRVSAVVMPMIFLGVAALILNILMTRLAEQQRTAIGTFKAFGYTNRTLSWHYLKFGMVVGLVGAAVGIVVGYAFTQGMIAMYRQYFEFPRLDNRAVPLAYLAAVVIGVVFSVLGTVRGVQLIVRLSPAEAMRAKPPVAGGAIGLERYRRLWRRLGFRWQMVARSVWRHRWRTTVGMSAAACGAALMLMAFYFSHATTYLIEFQFDRVLVSDMDLTFKDDRDFGAVLEVRRLPGVQRAEPLFRVACEFRHGHRTKKASITGVVPGADLTIPRDAAGTALPIPPHGLMMSRTLAEILDLDVGDEVTVVPVRGRREPIRVAVTSVTDSFVGIATYADFDELNRLMHETGAVSAVQVRTWPGEWDRGELFRRIKALPAVAGVSDNEQMKANLVTLLVETMKISLTALVGFAGAIYFGGILTTSFVAVSERRREVATMLVMGYGRRQVGGIFLRESMLVNTMGSLVGLVLGVGLVLLVIDLYDTEVYRMPLQLEPLGFVLTVAFGVLFTLLAHGLVQRKVNKLDWLEALNARE